MSGTSNGAARRRDRLRYVGLLSPAILLALSCAPATAGQLDASAFQAYTTAAASTIQPGPFALYTVNVDSLLPTQQNEGFTEVGKKTAGFDLLTPSQLQANLLTDIEPVVIGPGGKLYLTDGHHTFTALENSIYGASNPTVYVNVIANYSNLTTAQFFQTMQAQNLLLPLNDGVPETVDLATGAPLPISLTGLTSDPYRGLEYSILKNKSSKLFPTAANITGAIGAKTPGLDKMTGFYSDFLEAEAYRNANNGLGLPYLSPGDIALATQWNLNGASKTSLPNVAGTVTAAQLPGFILANNIVNNTVISDATLANGALDGNGTFTGITTINAGTAAAPITIGTPNTGFVLQLGNDKGFGVTLGGANTYTGGTSILAGDLIVASDASLGAAVPTGATIDPNNVKASVQAANGIIFNSLTEGNGTLTLGTTAGNGTSTFTTARPIAVDGEAATINLNGYVTTLTGQLVSLGSNGVGLGNATGVSDLTIDDNSSNNGVLTLSTPSPYFYGNLIVGNTNAPTVVVTNDAALGNTGGPAASIGQVELNGGTFKAGASFSAPERNFFLASGSDFDVAGFTTSWGTLTDTQRTLDILNSNATTAGAVTFADLQISATATLQLAGGAAGESVTFTNGIARTAQDTLIIQPTSATSLGVTDKVLSGTGAASLVNGIAPAWIVTNNGGSKSAGPYDFVTYGSNGYVKAIYSATTLSNAPTSVVALAANATAAGPLSAYALNTEGKTITLGANTLTLGDGTNPAGLILASGSAIAGGTLAFGSSEGVVWLSGTNPTISSTITGSNGLTFAGSGGVTLSTASTLSGPITVDSGSVTLSGTNVFAADASGLLLDDVKKSPAPATLAVSANNTLTALNSVGNNSAVTLSNGAILTLGDTTYNLSSTLGSTVTEKGAATAGALTFDGSGLFDLSGGSVTLAAGSTAVVDNSARLRLATGAIGSTFGITLNGTSELQLAQNGGGVLANTITGTGDLRLIGGTLQITGTANTYSGGTFVETGSTLDVTTANLPATNPNITDAGGLVVFDQATNGTYAGVISDGKQLGIGAMLSGSLDKDDSSGANSGNVTLTQAQTYTGATTVEAGTLTLAALDTLATSSGVDLGRVGGGSTATLALAANNTVAALTSELADTTTVALAANTLTLATAATTNATFGGTIAGAGNLMKTGAGAETLTGTNTYTGATTINGGTLEVDGSIASTNVTVNSGGTLSGTGSIGDPTIGAGGTLSPGSVANPYGRLDIAGPLTFAAGSFYDVAITPTANSSTVVMGATTIQGGTVNVSTAQGTYAPNTRYTILTSSGGVTGTFNSVGASNLAFFAASLSYDANDVFLNAGYDYVLNGATQNQRSIGTALTAAATRGASGTGAMVLGALNQVPTGAGGAALDAISGEGLAAAQNAAYRSTDLFISSIFDQTTFYGDTGGTANSITLTAPIHELADLPSRSFVPTVSLPAPRTWRAWATGFGGVDDVHGNAAVGSAAETDTLYGGTLGVDYRLSDNYLAGLAVGGSDAEFSVPGRATSGSVTGGHVAFYDLATFGAFYAATTTSASFYSNQTNRTTGGFGGIGNDTEHGSFQSHAYSTRLEVGRHVAAYGGLVTPFAALQLTELRSYGFTEQAVSGPGLLALNVQGQDSASVPSLLGLRFQYVMPLGNGLVLSPSLQVAWEHEFSPQRQIDANLVNLPTATFVVDGARPARDSAAVKAGAELAITSQASLFANFDGEFSGVDQFYAGKGGFKYVW